MYGPRGYYGRENKPDRERQITNKINRFIETGNKPRVIRAGRSWGAGEIGERD